MHAAYFSLKTEQCFVAMYSVVGGELPNQENPTNQMSVSA